MRTFYACLVVLLLPGPLLLCQEKPSLGKEAPEERPTLGKDGSSPNGPKTSTTNDARRLMSIRTLYVDHIDNDLSDKLADGLSKMGRFRIVLSRQEADAIVSGTCFDSHRLKTVHSEVTLNDRASGASIWQDVVRRPYNPPPLDKAVGDTASAILAHLGESIQEAERK